MHQSFIKDPKLTTKLVLATHLAGKDDPAARHPNVTFRRAKVPAQRLDHMDWDQEHKAIMGADIEIKVQRMGSEKPQQQKNARVDLVQRLRNHILEDI
jgi:hypothetical protein